MGAALTLLILATIALSIIGGVLVLCILWVLATFAARIIQHEMLMRPKERYYTM